MQPRKHILVFVDWYLPGYKAGGPIRSVANIVRELSNEFDFSIVTTDRDWGENSPYTTVATDTWTAGPNGEQIIYLSPANVRNGVRAALKQQQFDCIYLNSLFSLHFAIVPLLVSRGKRYGKVVAPRGMLGAGALQLKSGKKKAFLFGSNLLGLFKDVTWHASTAQESDEIVAKFGAKANVTTALNIAGAAPTNVPNKPKSPGFVHLFFLSRISQKKNLLGAIEILHGIELAENEHVIFDIFGPVEDQQYWQQCQDAIAKLPKQITVSWKGAVPNHELAQHLEPCHCLLLPTQHENYGHVILESLSFGCPVMISDQTPWRDLSSQNIGWDIAINDSAGWQTALRELINCTQHAFDEMSQQAATHAAQFAGSREIIEQNRKLFRNA